MPVCQLKIRDGGFTVTGGVGTTVKLTGITTAGLCPGGTGVIVIVPLYVFGESPATTAVLMITVRLPGETQVFCSSVNQLPPVVAAGTAVHCVAEPESVRL